MSRPEALRARVAAQLDQLCAQDGPLAANGQRATTKLAHNYQADGHPTRERQQFRRGVISRYLARQQHVPRDAKAALLTAGPPGAGKSTVLDSTTDVAGWRRLDADLVKTYLIEDAVAAHRYDDLLSYELVDGHPILPAELAPLVHIESLSLLDDIRDECVALGENVVIEGTLTWPSAGAELLDDLIAHGYSEVTILDIEVPAKVAHERALTRWWTGRHERINSGRGLGGRFTPADAIDRAYPDPAGRHSVCAANARALFDSPTAADIDVMTLTVHDSTGQRLAVHTYERLAGQLQPRSVAE